MTIIYDMAKFSKPQYFALYKEAINDMINSIMKTILGYYRTIY